VPLIAFAACVYSEGERPADCAGRPGVLHGDGAGAVLFVYGMYRAGYVSNPSLPRRTERLQPAVFAVTCAVAAVPDPARYRAAQVFVQLDAGLLLQMVVLAVVTIWWKISYHAAGAAGLALALLAWGGTTAALPVAMLALVIGWARVRLDRHTPAQVAAGWLSALAAVLVDLAALSASRQ